GAAGRGLRHHRLPWLRARRPPPQRRGDERASARDGSDASLRPVQSRPPDLCGTETLRHRAPVRPPLEIFWTGTFSRLFLAGRKRQAGSVSPAAPRAGVLAGAWAPSPATRPPAHVALAHIRVRGSCSNSFPSSLSASPI